MSFPNLIQQLSRFSFSIPFCKRFFAAITMLIVVFSTGIIEFSKNIELFTDAGHQNCTCMVMRPRLCMKYGVCRKSATDACLHQNNSADSNSGTVVLGSSCTCHQKGRVPGLPSFNQYRFVPEDFEGMATTEQVQVSLPVTNYHGEIRSIGYSPEVPPPESA